MSSSLKDILSKAHSHKLTKPYMLRETLDHRRHTEGARATYRKISNFRHHARPKF
jgi:hypothetical protein